MTSTKDSFKDREIDGRGGKEESEGVPLDGFSDPNGEFPNRDFFYGSGISKAARGEKINELHSGGGDLGVDVTVAEQTPSQYPYNQAQETQSGHSFEMDDTPGGERILIKHRTGAGMELRADGSVIISSQNKRVSVTGGDDVVIVEGKADLVYKGDVTLRVEGNFNVDVGGNYNLNVSGDKVENIKGRHKKIIDKDQNYTIRGSRGTQVGQTSTDTVLGNSNIIVKNSQKFFVEGNVEIAAGNDMTLSATNEWTTSAQTANLTARTVSMLGHKGTFGGTFCEFQGKHFGGVPIPLIRTTLLAGVPIPAPVITSTATFAGNLAGKAAEAVHANTAGHAGQAMFAVTAGCAPTGPAVPLEPVPGSLPYWTWTSIAGIASAPIIESQLMTSKYGIRNISIDDKLRQKIELRDEYFEAFNFVPNIHQIRSKLRDFQWRTNRDLTSYLIAQGRLSETFAKTLPKKIGRTVGKKGNIHFGVTLIGNDASDNRSKRFKIR